MHKKNAATCSIKIKVPFNARYAIGGSNDKRGISEAKKMKMVERTEMMS